MIFQAAPIVFNSLERASIVVFTVEHHHPYDRRLRDVAPVTLSGRIIAGFIAILGSGMFALPAGILGTGFLEELQQRRWEGAGCVPTAVRN